MTEEESAAVRQAIYKILAPWISGNISFHDWCIEVDLWFPDQNTTHIGAHEMTTSADRSMINRALAKAIAYKNCGQDEKAFAWAAKLVDLLECNDILTNRAYARTIGLEG